MYEVFSIIKEAVLLIESLDINCLLRPQEISGKNILPPAPSVNRPCAPISQSEHSAAICSFSAKLTSVSCNSLKIT